MEELMEAVSRKPDVIYIVITLADDAIVIFHFVVKAYGPNGEVRMHRPPTPDNIEISIKKTNYGIPVKSWRYAGPDVYPSTPDGGRMYRAAWRDDGHRIVHDLNAMREIGANRLRRARRAQFPSLDGAHNRAVDEGRAEDAAKVGLARKRLRDCPAEFTAACKDCTTPEEIHSHVVRIMEETAAEATAASKI
jgi:hypothetical protein